MATIYELKPRFQSLLRPMAGRLVAAGIRPNFITVVAVAGSLSAGLLLLLASRHAWVMLLLPVWLFVRMALNAVDGMMAREFNMTTATGTVLNELGDVLSDLFLYLPLAAVEPGAAWFVVAFSIGAVLTEFCGVLASALGAGRRYDGPMGKSDRAFLVGLTATATFFAPSVGRLWAWIFGAATALSLLTCWNRTFRPLRETR